MEVEISVPHGTDISVLEKEFPDIYQDADDEEDDTYYVGRTSDDPLKDDDGKEIEWLTYNEAVECCGFAEGAIAGASVLIEGNGGWAQGMISRKDFSGLAVSAAEKRAYKNTSNRFWKAYRRGKKLRIKTAVKPTK